MGKPTITVSEWEREIRKALDATPKLCRRPWTPAECRVLRDYYLKVPTRALAEQLGRSVRSVENKAHDLPRETQP